MNDKFNFTTKLAIVGLIHIFDSHLSSSTTFFGPFLSGARACCIEGTRDSVLPDKRRLNSGPKSGAKQKRTMVKWKYLVSTGPKAYETFHQPHFTHSSFRFLTCTVQLVT